MPSSNPNFPDGLHIEANMKLSGSSPSSCHDKDSISQSIRQYGIAGRIWEAAEYLVDYLMAKDSIEPECSIFRNGDDVRTIIELGSGTGYVGLRLAELLLSSTQRNDLIILTDLPEVCPLLEENLRRHSAALVNRSEGLHGRRRLEDITKIQPLSWGNHRELSNVFERCFCRVLQEASSPMETQCSKVERNLSHIICSDLVYFPHLLAPLLRTLLLLTDRPFAKPDPSPEVIISYKIRSLSKETPFWAAFGLWFHYKPILSCEDNSSSNSKTWKLFGPCPADDSAYVFIAHRREESLDWPIPEKDTDLLDGIGAGGTPWPKSDNTFETMLLMQMDTD